MPRILSPGDNPGQLHCRICGQLCVPKLQGWKNDAVCSQDCFDEYKWRDVLSIMHKPYYVRPAKDENVAEVAKAMEPEDGV